MRHDIQNQLCVAQAFTTTAVSNDSYEKITASQDLSIGRRVALLVCPVVNAGAGSTHLLEAIQADDGALTTNVEVIGSNTVLATDLVKGAEIEVPIAQGKMTRRYLGFRDTITGGATTVTLDVWIVPQDENPKNTYFPKVINALV